MRNDSVLGYEAPISFHKTKKGYYYSDEKFSIQSLPLNDEELQAIRFASQTLYQFRDSDLFRDYYSAIDKIFSKVVVSQPNNDKKMEKLIQFEKEPVEVQMDHLPLLIRAVSEHLIVDFNYVKFDNSETRSHKIHPLLLREYRNRWYVVALVPDIKEVLVFGLDRIRDMRISTTHFRRPADFDADEYFKYSLGITRFNHEKPQKVVLSFDISQAKYLRSKPIHATQSILADNKKEFRLKLEVQVSWELQSLILSYGDLVKVIQPASLSKIIQKRLRDSLKLYS